MSFSDDIEEAICSCGTHDTLAAVGFLREEFERAYAKKSRRLGQTPQLQRKFLKHIKKRVCSCYPPPFPGLGLHPREWIDRFVDCCGGEAAKDLVLKGVPESQAYQKVRECADHIVKGASDPTLISTLHPKQRFLETTQKVIATMNHRRGNIAVKRSTCECFQVVSEERSWRKVFTKCCGAEIHNDLNDQGVTISAVCETAASIVIYKASQAKQKAEPYSIQAYSKDLDLVAECFENRTWPYPIRKDGEQRADWEFRVNQYITDFTNAKFDHCKDVLTKHIKGRGMQLRSIQNEVDDWAQRAILRIRSVILNHEGNDKVLFPSPAVLMKTLSLATTSVVLDYIKGNVTSPLNDATSIDRIAEVDHPSAESVKEGSSKQLFYIDRGQLEERVRSVLVSGDFTEGLAADDSTENRPSEKEIGTRILHNLSCVMDFERTCEIDSSDALLELLSQSEAFVEGQYQRIQLDYSDQNPPRLRPLVKRTVEWLYQAAELSPAGQIAGSLRRCSKEFISSCNRKDQIAIGAQVGLLLRHLSVQACDEAKHDIVAELINFTRWILDELTDVASAAAKVGPRIARRCAFLMMRWIHEDVLASGLTGPRLLARVSLAQEEEIRKKAGSVLKKHGHSADLVEAALFDLRCRFESYAYCRLENFDLAAFKTNDPAFNILLYAISRELMPLVQEVPL
jgi:hypothetical protein